VKVLVVLIAAAVLTAAVASSHLIPAAASSPAARDAGQPPLPPAASAGEMVLYGHIKSLTRKGNHFQMRFDPAWWLSGVTAQRAAVADKAIRPGQAVPNDYYIVEEGHRLLTYVVPQNARVTVLTRHGGRLIPTTAITVSELAQIVRGKNPRHRQLMEPKAGFWIRVATDSVRSLDQQYQP
jgi:hypothetical protein